MKKITIIISKCCECPKYSIGFLSEPDECDITRKIILDNQIIPEWCPLENEE